MKKTMTGMKRLMAILLCFVLVTGGMGAGASAAETAAAQAETEEAYDSETPAPLEEEESAVNDDAESAANAETARDRDTATVAEEEYSADEEDAAPENDEKEAPYEEVADPDNEEKATPDEEAADPEDEGNAAPVEEPYEGDSEGDAEETGLDTDALIEAPLSSDEAMATDNAAESDTVLNNVPYKERSWDGTKVVSSDKTAAEVKPVPSDGNMKSGWYYLNSNVTKNGRVNLEGDTYLILGDGYTLNVKGLYIPKGSTLTIYAESFDREPGRLISKPTGGGAAIGGTKDNKQGGSTIIHGGTIEVTGDDHCAGIGSNDGAGTTSPITIYGGKITAIGGSDGAGIGGGRKCDGGTITIYGGDITAKGGGENGAGIGGGYNGAGGKINIYGGTITAGKDPNEDGAGIGGGDSGSGGEITINGGTVTVYSRDGAGIGGGDNGDGGTITINGGTVTSNKVNLGQGARIGGGSDANGGTVTINGGKITAAGGKGACIGGGKGCKGGSVTINGGNITATGSYGIGKGEEGKSVPITLGYTEDTKDTISITASSYGGTVTLDKPFAKYTGSKGEILAGAFTEGVVSDSYLLVGGVLKAWSGETQSDLEYTKYSWDVVSKSLTTTTVKPTAFTELTSDMEDLTSGTYVVSGNMTIDHYISVRKESTVNLVVKQGAVLTCTKGIGCGYSKDGKYATLNIFGQGSIIATGKENAAGIGGADDEASGDITIHGTTVKATGGKHGAGIGGGEGGKDPDGKTSIIIYAGTVTATGGIDGAGIGGGDEQPGAHTYIYSGTITADSKKHGAGIGGGDEEGTLGIFIYSGKVTATGGSRGAGIGGGEEGGALHEVKDGGGINIFGGEITATGGEYGAGIGGGFNVDMSGTINITGFDTEMTVTGGVDGAGIGAGSGNWGTDGDMNGTITIDCGAASDIQITGGTTSVTGAAGIGAGEEGNMNGTLYYKGGNVVVTGGKDAAGIGGGSESFFAGGEGGTVYVGGGDLKINVNATKASAIGNGGNDFVDGTVYITADKNGTGKYLRVDYCDYIHGEKWKTAKASDRSSKCHDNLLIEVTECDHEDCHGNSGLTYTIKGDKHRKTCKYCGLDVTEGHRGADCECGYRAETFRVELSDASGVTEFTVARGKEFELPDYGDQVMSGNMIPPDFYRVKGWQTADYTPGEIYEPGEFITVNDNSSFVSVREYLYRITFDEVLHGSIKADLTDGKTYAPEGETLSFGVEADPGYSVGKVTYQIMNGYETDDKGNAVYHYSDPVEIPPVDGEYRLTMPEMTSVDGVDNNVVVISAEISQNREHSVFIPEDLTGGTVTADRTTAAEGDTVTLTVTTASNYHLETIRCRKDSGEEVGLTPVSQDGETSQYTFLMPAEDVEVTAEWEAASAVLIKGVTGSFNDKIKLNYYLDIPEEVLADEDAYVTITNERTGKGVTLPVKEAPFNQVRKGYKFSILLVAKEASDTITAKMYGGSGSAVTLIGEQSGRDYTATGARYTLMQYFDWLEREGVDEEKPLGAAARDYCTAAQIYFEYHADGLEVSSAVKEVTADMLSGYVAGRDGELPAGVSIEGISAMLEADNTLRLYYGFKDVDPTKLSYAVDGEEASLKQRSDGKYYLALDKGVYSNHLQDTHTYTISDGTDAGTCTITASVLTYARSCAGRSDEKEINLGKALYLYNKAAVAVFGQ